MTTDDLTSVAYHEAGHTVMAHRVGFDLGPVTIEPGESFLGCTWYTPPRIDQDLMRHVVDGAVGPLLPVGLQRLIELDVLVTVAGEMAEWLHRISAEEPTSRPASTSSATRPLPADEAAQVAAGQEDTTLTADEEHLWKRAMFLNDRDLEAVEHYQALARRHARHELERTWPKVERLAAELLVHRTLSTSHVNDVLTGVRAT